MILHEYTISALGHLANSKEQDLAALPRDAVGNAGRLLDRHGNKFQATIAGSGSDGFRLQWESDDLSCAKATFSAGQEMLSTNIILSGLRPEADRRLLAATHEMLKDICRAAGATASDGLLKLPHRPALVYVRWSSREEKGMDVVRDLEVCLAAAFLERGFEAVRLALLR